MSERRRLLGELSWFQVIAGALAAMTAAWLASYLGVAGTVVGAAVGSAVVTISSGFYSRTLDKGRTLVVQTDAGTRIQSAVSTRLGPRVDDDAPTEVRATEQLDAVDATDPEPDGDPEEPTTQVTTADPTSEVPEKAAVNWRVVAVGTVAALVLSLVGIGGYELITDRSYGDPDNARIGNPLGGDSTPTAPTQTPAPTATTEEPTPTATTSPTPTPRPTATTATPTPTATPTEPVE